MGISSAALAEPVSSPSGATFAYASSAGCDISGTRVISYSTVANCVITVTATLSGHNQKSQDFTVSGVQKGNQSAPVVSHSARNIYGATSTVNVEGGRNQAVVRNNVPTNGQTSLVYESSNPFACRVNTTSGTVTMFGRGDNSNCQVNAKWVSNNNWNESPTAQVGNIRKGTDARSDQDPLDTTIDGSAYSGRSTITGTTATIVTAPSGGGGRGSVEYKSKTPNECSVGRTNGTVSITASSGTCTIQARWSGTTGASSSSYKPSGWADIWSFTITTQ